MNEACISHSQILKWSRQGHERDLICLTSKGEMKCAACGKVLIELTPLRARKSVRLAALQFEGTTNSIEILISTDIEITALFGKIVCALGRIRLSSYNPNSLVKRKNFIDWSFRRAVFRGTTD